MTLLTSNDLIIIIIIEIKKNVSETSNTCSTHDCSLLPKQ